MKRTEWVLVALGTLLWISLSALRVQNAPIIGMNSVRPVASIALAKGFPIFYAGGKGPLISGLNGPLPPVLNLPVALAKTPTAVMYLGSVLAILYSLLPALFLFWLACRQRRTDFNLFALLSLTFVFLGLHSRALIYSFYLIHADAPALGFLALSIAALAFGEETKRWRSDALGALAAVAAVLCKVTFLPLLVSTFLFVALRDGRKNAVKFAAYEAVLGLAALAISVLVFGSGLYYTNVSTVAASGWVASLTQPNAGFAVTTGAHLKVLIAAINELLQEYLQLSWVMVPLLFVVPRSAKRPWVLTALTAICLLPPSLLGRVKAGGDLNTQSPFVYAALLTVVFLFRDAVLETKPAVAKVSRVGLVAFLMSLAVLSLHFLYEWSWTIPIAQHQSTETAFHYLKKHPGAAYFPDEPLAHILAEGNLFHSWATISEYATSGNRIDAETFALGFPNPPRPIYFLGRAHGPWRDYFPSYHEGTSDPALPGWQSLQK